MINISDREAGTIVTQASIASLILMTTEYHHVYAFISNARRTLHVSK